MKGENEARVRRAWTLKLNDEGKANMTTKNGVIVRIDREVAKKERKTRERGNERAEIVLIVEVIGVWEGGEGGEEGEGGGEGGEHGQIIRINLLVAVVTLP